MLQNFPSKGLNLPKVSSSFINISRSEQPSKPSTFGNVHVFDLSKSSPNGIKPLSEKYINDTLKQLGAALDSIFNDKPISTSLEVLYRGVEAICRSERQLSLAAELKMRMKAHVEVDLLQKELLPSAKAHGSLHMVEKVGNAWLQWSKQLKIIQSLFVYLDRSYLQAVPGEKSIWNLGVDELFRKIILGNTDISSELTSSLLKYFKLNRSGKPFDRELVKTTIHMLSTLGAYFDEFHLEFINSTQKFYSKLAEEMASSLNTGDYLKAASKYLTFESDQAKEFDFDRKTKAETAEVTRQSLIFQTIDFIIGNGFEQFVEDDDIESLSLLYSLFAQVDGLDVTVKAWSDYIRSEGFTFVQDPSRDQEMVKSLLKFKAKLDKILEQAFKNDVKFHNALRESFESFINKRQNVPAERIAKYIDELMKIGNRQMEDTEMDDRLERVLVLFRFIQGKDTFEAFYKKDLAKRLLLNKSASDDAEAKMLQRLKVECGTGFTKKLNGMFKDMAISKDMMRAFKESKHATDHNVELSVNVLSQAEWPTYPDVPVILPPTMNSILEDFSNYYHSQHKGRRLFWRHSLDHCTIRADFPKGKKELGLSLFQTVVVLKFNNIPDGGYLSYEEIKAETGLVDHELQRTLQSLACGKIRILSKEPKGRDVNPGDRFKVNLKLDERAYRLRINQIQLKESAQENKQTHEEVKRDRQFEIQACITRIMKARKQLTHTELVQQVIEQTKNRGVVEMSDIKKNIDKLIEKDYIERDGASKGYIYLA
ncbi:Cullin family-domain-containing protein [Lipomyces japonicus]|uniref:Cullin family-domain-containing protein n=1 Tax=Lipomyces japonicus TaxID=56871 RepID=UPI0034CDA4EF